MPLDHPVAAGMVRELQADLDERYGPEDDGGAGWLAEVTPEKVTPPDGIFLVASWDGEPVGCGALKRLGPTTGEIKRMYVSTRGRRRGVARAVLARLEAEARALGYERLQLETGEVQPEAIALYDSAGWSRIPAYGRYQDDPRSVCFAKTLAPVRDALTGTEVVIVGSRQARPNLPATGCPFCPGGTEAPESYDVRWFVNRWPAMPDDRCEVVLYSPLHDATMWSLGVDGVRKVVDLWADRTAALGARTDVDYVLAFENRGPEVGATIAHPHGQIYAFDHVPPAARVELDGPCALCASPPHVVHAAGGWTSSVPAAASSPYELRLAPVAHTPDLPSLDTRDGLAAVLVDSTRRLDALFGAPMPYMLWVHQRPTDGGHWPGAHVHVHIAPLLRAASTPRFVAAGELGSGVFFNPVEPAVAAAALRDA